MGPISGSLKRTSLSFVALSLLGVMIFSSCVEQKTDSQKTIKKEKVINPNGDSELALLMREMFDEGDRVKQQILAGEVPSGLKKFEIIHSAIPTDENASGPVFEGFATSYIQAIKALENSDSASVFKFNNMVDQCMNCHTEFCPGPKRRIKKLYISEG
ncbi:MAG: hypothetical protein ACI85F_002936 [Bacteroidia bacterium]|jgi:hypothetical protein